MSPRMVLRIEQALTAISGVLLVLTLITREWIELLFGVDPDGGSGALEWALVAGFALSTVVFGLLARRQAARLDPA